jgi:hypothetical protein
MKANYKHLKKAFMWHKVKELFDKGFNKSQISLEVGIHRKTVREYLSMSEEDFYRWLDQPRKMPKKLNGYYVYVRDLLRSHPYLSAAQVEDRLKEAHGDLPVVHSKTVYNFVQMVRDRDGIAKGSEKQPRQYGKLPEADYGHMAQVDFGQYNMQTKGEGRKRVHFFVMVLCRSRQKFVCFSIPPFTTATTVDAHEKAFAYFWGRPKEIVYDQDRVLVSSENLGDVLLAQEFQTYCSQTGLRAVFCRKSDPESKGKVENAVKYVKHNFLRGRVYCGEEELNRSAVAWLDRTANGKEHGGTKKVPSKEWEIERVFLVPAQPLPGREGGALPRYKVRKDNTISYKSNFYSLPLGTYGGQDTWVLLKEAQGEVHIYALNGEPLAVHGLCYQRGKTIRNSDHSRDKSQGIAGLKESVLQMMPDRALAEGYLDMLHKDKPRYFRDNLLALKKRLPGADPSALTEALAFCLETGVYNGDRLLDVANHRQAEARQVETAKAVIAGMSAGTVRDVLDIAPETSNISIYETLL